MRGMFDVTPDATWSWSRRFPVLIVLAVVLIIPNWATAGVPATSEATMPSQLLASPIIPAGAAIPGPGDQDEGLYEAVLTAYRSDVIAETDGWLSRYRISATLTPATDDEPVMISGRIELSYVNDTDQTRDALYFRLYGNDPRYAEGEIVMRDVVVNGVSAEATLSEADTVVEVALPEPLASGAAVDLAYGFDVIIPESPRQSYGMFAYLPEGGTISLAHWFPMLAGYGPDGQWNLMPVSVFGDPIFSNTALFDVTFTLPVDLIPVATGIAVDTTVVDDEQTVRFVSGPARDFTMVVDDDYERIETEIDGTTVISWFNPQNRTGGEGVLRYGAQALELFNELLGPYPYAQLDFVDVTVRGGAAGIEFPQILFIGGDYYRDPNVQLGLPNFLENITAHEVIHQWFYALVGNDQYRHAFIDEGLTNYLTVLYFERVYGPEEGQYQYALNLELPYLRLLFGPGDQIADQLTDDFPSMGIYGTTIYSKAALGFGAIHAEIGEDAFFSALQTYVADLRFGVAVPADLKQAFEDASGEDLSELWRFWFEAAEGEDIYDESDLERMLEVLNR